MIAMLTYTGVPQRFSVLFAALYQLRLSSKILQMLPVFAGGDETQALNKAIMTKTKLRRILVFLTDWVTDGFSGYIQGYTLHCYAMLCKQ